MKFGILIAVLIAGIAVAGVIYYEPAGPTSQSPEPQTAITKSEAKTAPIEKLPESWFFPNRPARLVAMEGKPAPEIRVKDWIGESTTISDLKGKVVVLDFWATWCGPCVMSIPHNVAMVKRFSPDEFAFIGIHDANRGWDRVASVARDKKINYPLAIDAGNSTISSYGVSFFPTYVVIDRNGIIRGAGLAPNYVENAVEKLLNE